MQRVIDYYFTPASPWAYLGHDRFAAIARDAGVRVDVKPMDIGRVFATSGGLPLAKRAPQRQAYRLVELRRWSEWLGVPINLQPKFHPFKADPAVYWILAAAEVDSTRALAFCGAVGKAFWAEERNPADVATLTELARASGLDAAAIGERAANPEIVSYYDTLTQQAIDVGVFGAPTYLYQGEMFWGQDRLDFLARKLAK